MKKIYLFSLIILILAIFSLPLFSQEIPYGGKVTVKSGIPTIIYGQRSSACVNISAPDFNFAAGQVETKPQHGTLSDGGTGTRYSKACKGNVGVRVIKYTSNPGYVGKDEVVISGDRVTIEIVP